LVRIPSSLLLQLLILCFELIDPGRKLAQLSLHSIQPTLDVHPILRES
jgi:hypothetical protein